MLRTLCRILLPGRPGRSRPLAAVAAPLDATLIAIAIARATAAARSEAMP